MRYPTAERKVEVVLVHFLQIIYNEMGNETRKGEPQSKGSNGSPACPAMGLCTPLSHPVKNMREFELEF
ncbi:hypothetical protein DNTS_022893 [Danionella cerebrum]|uniref:Uncharacterized protein n=1 Tax=Danionella cerebrum TaxID=2873325 RepID=A0A553QWI3_9TELE|nr:hypothetical protein DNTS_022893 [Danionella translucida]